MGWYSRLASGPNAEAFTGGMQAVFYVALAAVAIFSILAFIRKFFG